MSLCPLGRAASQVQTRGPCFSKLRLMVQFSSDGSHLSWSGLRDIRPVYPGDKSQAEMEEGGEQHAWHMCCHGRGS